MTDKKKQDTSKKNDKTTQKLPKNFFKTSILNNIFFYVFLMLGAYLLYGLFFPSDGNIEEKPISDVISAVKAGTVQTIKVSEDTISIQLKDGTKFKAQKETAISFAQLLSDNGVNMGQIGVPVTVEHPVTFIQILSPLLMFGLPILLVFFIFRQMKGANNEIMSFGRSRAKVFNKDFSKTTFADVAGNEEAKTEMMEIVDFLKNAEKYRKLGARIPKGVLLVGPAGVGKTLLAKAIAGEANVPFFSVAGSEFMEMLVGVGSARARDLFRMAKESQPSLIFIDEIDAIGRQRGMGIGGGHDEREQTLNQILTEMDGFDPRTEVIVIAATNRADMLDPALIRAGRFDRRISIPLPDLKDRQAIIKIHMKGKPFADDVQIESVAKKTVGFSGADIENMLNESAILAARENRDKIIPKDLEEASMKVTMGAERKTLQTEEERKLTAYHEAGHALVASFVPDMDPVHRVSIVARGASLGHTSFPPERDRYNETKTRLISIITTMLGGRAAEEVVYNEQTIGASDDIDKATKLAHQMVASFGMSSLGPISYESREGNPWLAREMTDTPISQETASKVDQEVKKLIDSAYIKAKKILVERREILDRIAQRLIEKETLENEEYLSLLSPNA